MRNKLLSTVIKLTALVLVLCAVYTLVSLQGQISQKEQMTESLKDDVSAVQQEIQRIQENIDSISSDEAIGRIARDELGLVSPGEIVFEDVGN